MDSLQSSRFAKVSDIEVGSEVMYRDSEVEYFGKVGYLKDEMVYFVNCVKTTVSLAYAGSEQVGSICESGNSVYVVRDNEQAQELKPIPLKMVRRRSGWISNVIAENRPYKLPIFMNTEVFEGIVVDMINSDWLDPCMELVEKTSILMKTATDSCIQRDIRLQSFPKLRDYLLWQSRETVENLTKIARDKAEDFARRETIPYTQNHYIYENVSRLRSQRLEDEVLASVASFGITIQQSTLSNTIKNIFERNQNKSCDEHMAEEMQHALNAYGKVALKRFFDTVPMICGDALHDFADAIDSALSGVTDAEVDTLLTAPTDTVAKRAAFVKEVETLERGLHVFSEIL